MSTELDAGWKDAMATALQARALPTGAAFTVAVQISGVTAEGPTAAAWRATDGWLSPIDVSDDADITVAIAGKDAVQVVQGTVPFAVGFMRGKVKISGDPAASMELLRASTK